VLETNRVIPAYFVTGLFFCFSRRKNNPGTFFFRRTFDSENLLLIRTTIV
jgi:hypothetical protein